MRKWIIGNALVAVGLAWLIVDRVLSSRYPQSWGGPNIGGGGLLLISLLAIVAGVVTLVLSGVEGLRARHAGTTNSKGPGGLRYTESPSRPPLSYRSRRLAPPALTCVLIAGYVAALVGLPGDSGNAGVNGSVGLSVDASGSPVLILQVCRGSIETLTVVGLNRGNEPNEVFVELTAPQEVTTMTAVSLLHPPTGWTGAPESLPLTTRPQLLLIATARGEQSTLREVDFTAGDLSSLDPGTVQYSSYDIDAQDLVSRRVPVADFRALACEQPQTSGD